MADLFTFSGQYGTVPTYGAPSGIAALVTPILEQFNLINKHYDSVSLSSDSSTPINFGGGVVNAHVVILKATGGAVQVAATSAYGTAQVIPCDDFVVVISRTQPITAINLTRTPGVSTTVEVFLGQIS